MLQRLRHSDSRTRHAALAALSSTLLDPADLQEKKRAIDSNLLQGIRERVMDSDLDCAVAAAACLANYLLFSDTSNIKHEMTAGWTVVLVQRLQECLKNLANSSLLKQRKHWIVLTINCLHALCGVIETNPQALDRIIKQNPTNIILGLLDHGASELETINSNASNDTSLKEKMQDLTIYASRCLHSALDDNDSLLQQIQAWDSIQNHCKNVDLPMLARIHCAGSLVSARVAMPQLLEQPLQSAVLPLLHANLALASQETNAHNLLQTYTDSFEQFKLEEADQKLEKEIIKKVNNRKEPARVIARRQKAIREAKEKLKKGEVVETEQEATQQQQPDAKMEATDANINDEDKKQKADETMAEHGDDSKSGSAEERLEDARMAWNNMISPLELALEVTANLTALYPVEADFQMEMDMGDGDEHWTEEQEARVQEQYGQGEEATLSPEDTKLANSLVEARFPFQLVELLKQMTRPLPDKTPKEVLASLEDLQSKCVGCIANCAGYPQNWTDGFLQELCAILKMSNGKASVAKVMAATLRARPEVRRQMQPQDLNLIIQLASTPSCQREGIEMLGILCSSEPHPSEINKTVAETLLKIDSRRASIVNEILNALMDIYGDDENHPDIFVDLKVLNYFQTKLPDFKKWIKCDKDDASPEDVEEWKETALNSSRFISYKKGQL